MKNYRLTLQEKNGGFTSFSFIYHEAEHVNDVQVYFYNNFSRFTELKSIEEIDGIHYHTIWSASRGYID